MKTSLFLGLALASTLGLATSASGSDKKPASDSAPDPAAKPAAVKAATAEDILKKAPRSEFAMPASAKDGRNPFFPRSSQFQPRPAPVTFPEVAPPPPDMTASLVLNGITGPPRPSVMINSRTLLKGESGEVRLPTGEKVIVKCEEIGLASAVIVVGNTRKELRLRETL